MSNLLVSVDERDTIRLYNKLCRNVTKVVASSFAHTENKRLYRLVTILLTKLI